MRLTSIVGAATISFVAASATAWIVTRPPADAESAAPRIDVVAVPETTDVRSEVPGASDTVPHDAVSITVEDARVPAQTMPRSDGPRCEDRAVTADALDEAFENGIDGMVGADYQRAFELDDGRVLWVFQDAFIEGGDGSDPDFVHNAGAIQDGMCFETLVGDDEEVIGAWIADASSTQFSQWFWPLDGYQADDETFVLFVAEMDERGDRYLSNPTPVATWTVEIDLDTMVPGELESAPDPGDALYGFEITTDDDHLYLYAQCHRQFGFSDVGHDDCAAEVHVARQPLGEPDVPLEYWDGDGWATDGATAADIAPATDPGDAARIASPLQVERDGDRWIGATKVDDWWGTDVHFAVAPSPEGPWTTAAVVPVGTDEEFTEIATYFVSFVPSDDDGRTLAISNNRWDGEFSDAYRPRFTTVPSSTWSESRTHEDPAGLWLPVARRNLHAPRVLPGSSR